MRYWSALPAGMVFRAWRSCALMDRCSLPMHFASAMKCACCSPAVPRRTRFSSIFTPISALICHLPIRFWAWLPRRKTPTPRSSLPSFRIRCGRCSGAVDCWIGSERTTFFRRWTTPYISVCPELVTPAQAGEYPNPAHAVLARFSRRSRESGNLGISAACPGFPLARGRRICPSAESRRVRASMRTFAARYQGNLNGSEAPRSQRLLTCSTSMVVPAPR